MYPLLSKIDSPSDLKKLKPEELYAEFLAFRDDNPNSIVRSIRMALARRPEQAPHQFGLQFGLPAAHGGLLPRGPGLRNEQLDTRARCLVGRCWVLAVSVLESCVSGSRVLRS